MLESAEIRDRNVESDGFRPKRGRIRHDPTISGSGMCFCGRKLRRRSETGVVEALPGPVVFVTGGAIGASDPGWEVSTTAVPVAAIPAGSVSAATGADRSAVTGSARLFAAPGGLPRFLGADDTAGTSGGGEAVGEEEIKAELGWVDSTGATHVTACFNSDSSSGNHAPHRLHWTASETDDTDVGGPPPGPWPSSGRRSPRSSSRLPAV